MGGPGQVIGKTLRMVWEEMFNLVIASIIWIVVGVLPAGVLFNLFGLPGALIALLITFPPINAGVNYLTNRLAHDYVGKPQHIFDGARRFAVPAYLLFILNAVILFVAGFNFQFYAQYNAPWLAFIYALWALLLTIWGWVQLYVFPLLIEQEQPSVMTALRNALFLAFASPALTLSLTALILFVLALVFLFLTQAVALLPVLALLPSVLALLGNVAVVQRLKAIRGDTDAVEEDEGTNL